jgi:N-acetylneuraminic acid mutarotase
MRAGHTATLLRAGTVLVVGGFNGDAMLASAERYDPRSAERYDPSRDAWTAAGSTAAVRNRGTATLLLDGTVLLAGGVQYGLEINDATEVLIVYSERYNPLTNSWIELALLNESPFAHTATRLGDGGVLLAGGRNTGQTYRSAIRYLPSFRRGGDYQSDLWQHVPDMAEP